MPNNNNTAIWVSNLILGVVAYYFLKKKSVENQTVIEKQKSADTIVDAVMNYQAKYFKDSEYFKGVPYPKDYYRNWKLLSMQLDKIRTAFGDQISIIRGYIQPYNGVVTEPANQCTEAWIYPTKGINYMSHLEEVVKTLYSTNMLSISKWQTNDNKTILIRI